MAPFTPFDADGCVNLHRIGDLARFYRAQGAVGVFVNGTTGECHSLSFDERIQLAEVWHREARAEGLKLIVHIGDNCLKNAKSLAQHACGLGVDGISAMPPSYFKPVDLGALVEYCEAVATHTPDTPFYYYHIPAFSGVNFPMADFLLEASGRVPNLRGVKYSSADPIDLEECIGRFGQEYHFLFGCDEALLAALALGVHGAVGSTYNFATPLYLDLVTAFEKGDFQLARQLQYQSIRMIRMLQRFGWLRAGKMIMAWLGMDCGDARSPFRPLTSEQKAALREELIGLNVLTAEARNHAS